MNIIDEARAELSRLTRMLAEQKKRVAALESVHEAWPPGVPKVTLRPGVTRKIFVNRMRAARLQPPIIVEDEQGKRWYASDVKIGNYPHPYGATMWAAEFKWTARDDVTPALWIETEAKLELTL